LQGCRDYRDCIVAVLGRKPESGVNKAAKSRPVRRTEKPPAGRKGTFDKAERVESAFALLSGK